MSIAVWGKPPDSYADDPLRALTAARELAASLSAIATVHGRTERVACGVTTGRAFCGNVGSPSRCEWAVVGEVLCARGAAKLACTADAAAACCCVRR